jgi:protocatechuate 3,4-dioxygenase beta subunit
MKRHPLTRRDMLENCIVRGTLVAAVPMSGSNLLGFWQQAEHNAHKPTPSDVLGPFFKKGAPNVKALRQPGDPGFPLRVAGKVYNTRGDLVPGAAIDIWQADHDGHYDVTNYRYRTKLLVEGSGEYAVDTVMPGHYDDRPAQHIHYLISAPGHKTLVTQVYFATDPFFEGDPDKNYQKRNIVHTRELVRPVSLYEKGAAHASVAFDIVLERA